MTVYVVQAPTTNHWGFTPDLSSATQYGAFRVLLQANEQPSLMPGPSQHKMRKALREFNDEDYLLWAGGDPVALMMAAAIAAEINVGRIKVLRWERKRDKLGNRTKEGFYLPIQIDLYNKGVSAVG